MKKVILTFEGEICVFPFKYRGEIYNHCTTRDKGRSWCATKVTYKNQVSTIGFCNPDWGKFKISLDHYFALISFYL